MELLSLCLSRPTRSILAGCLLLITGSALVAQDVPPAAEPDRLIPEPAVEAPTTRPNGPTLFKSLDAGIQLNLPPGEKVDVRDPNILAAVANGEKEWRFEVQRLLLEPPPAQLETQELPQGGVQRGLVDLVADDLERSTDGEVLRKSVTPLGSVDAGVITLRYPLDSAYQLRQVALIPASDTLFYRLVMTSPAPAGELSGLTNDPNVNEAVEVFSSTLNSFEKLFDLTPVREDQERHLERTRLLFINLTRDRMMESLRAEQWWRIKQNGKDIGYAYVVEEPAEDIPDNRGDDSAGSPQTAGGIRVGIRSHIVTDNATIDRQNWSWMAADRRQEKFIEETVLSVDGQPASEGFVVGTMTARQVPLKVDLPNETGIGPKTGIEVVDERKLEVTFAVSGQPETKSAKRLLPAWYVPRVFEHLLPRLVAEWGELTYLVAVYDLETAEVWQLYLDVAGLRKETVNGTSREVILVTLRRGLGGAATDHFIDPENYSWLGSVNRNTGVEVWPTDAETIRSLWEKADLSRPESAD